MGNSTPMAYPAPIKSPVTPRSQNTMLATCSSCASGALDQLSSQADCIGYDSQGNVVMPVSLAERTPQMHLAFDKDIEHIDKGAERNVAGTPAERAAEKKRLISKVPGQVFPDLPISDAREISDAVITVQMQKTNPTEKLSIRSVACQGSHCVEWIYPTGLLDNWNKANPGNAVQVYDHIVEVNGVQQNSDELKKTWLSEPNLCLKVVAAEVTLFRIVKKANHMLGIKTRASAKVHQITSITAGSVVDLLEKGRTRNVKIKGGKEYTNFLIKKKPKVGDYIVEVNGLRGDAEFLREEWICNTKADIVVISPRLRAPAHEQSQDWNAIQVEEQDG